MVTGPDVSEHQGSVDWDKVRGKHDLAIVRVADGDHRDPWYTEIRVREIRRAGLLLAPYYFASRQYRATARTTFLMTSPRR